MSEDRLFEFMSMTRSSQESSDILIYTNDNQSFLATRLMLVYSSPFFDVLLNGPFKKGKKLERQQTSTIYLNMTKDELYPVLARAMYGEDHGLRCTEEDVWKFILSWNRANNTEPSLALLLTARFGRMDDDEDWE
ncbi:uncharacterized protein LOC111701802 [Eurytemora carolleeae]|uniref:uncharacterized protein LOC111701802 n=1 Tax=Eurytemora carolleeae TaxID=1294199 RepID=UPI000C75E43F|nr:uncharacterized protein LOC111701802 [Eurytemora carolleeae]|eukprot:XP_023328999.1 uncharacterized protein LOC111701802 [Eurytemora affinis]